MKLNITKLQINGKTILKDIDIQVKAGSCIAILGRNGAGKSSLLYGITNHPKYVIDGDVNLETEKVFMSFQKPPEIPEITTKDLLLYLANTYDKPCESVEEFKKTYRSLLNELGFPVHVFDSALNKDLSGGENKKLELLCMHLMKPNLILLDEIDTGLDLDSVIELGNSLKAYCDLYSPTVVVVTHNMEFLKYFKLKKVVVFDNGKSVGEFPPTIVKQIKEQGFLKTFKI